jgi:hypothetical protein
MAVPAPCFLYIMRLPHDEPMNPAHMAQGMPREVSHSPSVVSMPLLPEQ